MTGPERRCTEHPTRQAETPCVRCGTFICDWCVKLAPSWGPGLCLACQKRTASDEPAQLPKTRGFIIVAAGTLLCPFMTLNELNETVRLPHGTPDERFGWLFAVVVLVLLLVWNVLAIIMFAVQRQRARGLLLGFFGFRAVISLLAVAGSWGQTPGAWLAILVNAAMFAYVGWSDDARVVFGTKP